MHQPPRVHKQHVRPRGSKSRRHTFGLPAVPLQFDAAVHFDAFDELHCEHTF